jgi:hypothetical protein
MGVDSNGDQVHTVGPEGTTAQQTAGAQPEATPETVHREAARGDAAGGRALVGGDKGHGHPDGTAVRGGRAAHAATRPRPAFTSAFATSWRNTAGSAAAAAGSSRNR